MSFVKYPSTERGGERPANGRSSAAPANTNGRSVVFQDLSKLHEVLHQIDAGLHANPHLYQRDGNLVRIVRVEDKDVAREHMAAGTPQIRAMSTATLSAELTRTFCFQQQDRRTGEPRNVPPHDRVVAAVKECGEWQGVRPLAGVIETPSMRPDGSILSTNGYDVATGYVYLPSRLYPAIAAEPTRDDAHRALGELGEPWAEFPLRSETDRYVPIAALLTLLARPAIRGACPAFGIDASTRGSGKTLCARAISALAHGREAALMTWPSDPDELEKVLGAYALRGAPIICFDNLNSTFGGAPLDKVLTCADRVELRVLGRSELPSLSWRTVVITTGNNIVLGGDTARRVLMCRLEPMMERPEERTGYAIPDLIPWCQAHHPRLVAAALTLLRAFVVAGRPAQGLAGWGSFEAWRDLIANAIVWAGGQDVMACRPTLAGEDDPETAALRTIVDRWPSIAPNGTTIGSILGSLYPPERMRSGAPPPDGYDDLREALEALAPPTRTGMPPDAQRLGLAFRRLRDRVISGRLFKRAPQPDRSNTARWIVVEAGK